MAAPTGVLLSSQGEIVKSKDEAFDDLAYRTRIYVYSEIALAASNYFSRRSEIRKYQYQEIQLMKKSDHQRMTSIASLTITLALVTSLAACGGGADDSSSGPRGNTESAAPAPAPAPAP
ncbi:MAG: hypothetical protein IV107_14375, partial [Paucibacter sp.]|nr:hypothetical protein [Roseateles sp.]